MTTGADPTADELDRYRMALRTAIQRSSLRTVAQDLEMSPTGLANFIDGTQPYGKTVARLQRWYQREAGLDRVRTSVITDQLRQIVATLREPDAGVANLLDAVERSYASEALPSPSWVARARADLRHLR